MENIFGANGQTKNRNKIQKEQWNRHFCNLLEGQEEKPTIKVQKEVEIERLISKETEMLDREFDIRELENTIKKMKMRKSPGKDGIINEFVKSLSTTAKKKILRKLNEIWFADDIAVITETSEWLQEMINGLERYITRNRLEINMQKSQIMVFRRGGRLDKSECWTYHGHPLTVTNKYKYLRYVFTTTNVATEHVLSRATKAQGVINCVVGLSVLLYGVEIWGLRGYEAAEKVYRRYMKMSIQISRNCPDYIWLMELGMHELKITTMKRVLKYVMEIANMDDYRWPKVCLRILVSEEVQKSRWRQDLDCRRCWAQLRCSTLERASHVWMPPTQRRCRLGMDNEETLLHIFLCREMEDFKQLHVLGRVHRIDTEARLIQLLTGPIDVEVVDYIQEAYQGQVEKHFNPRSTQDQSRARSE
uniref:Reverse transcriptase domain-containing protein n=1 Tax=Strigamia maritima TaxID=126957 RepID=T1IKG2_STRMM